jgi:hypothetical protein
MRSGNEKLDAKNRARGLLVDVTIATAIGSLRVNA